MRHLFLVVTIMFLIVGCGGGKQMVSSESPLRINLSGSSRQYTNNEVVELQIRNIAQQKVYYFVGLECLSKKGDWIEFIVDTNTPYHAGMILDQIEPEQVKKRMWPNQYTDKVDQPSQWGRKQLRFVVYYQLKLPAANDDLKKSSRVYSDEFTYFGKKSS